MTENKTSAQLWGGRFVSHPNEVFFRYNRSFGFDVRLLPFDIEASRAWSLALEKVNVLTANEGASLRGALAEILKTAQGDADFVSDAANSKIEDVHSFLETQLIKRVGDVGKKLHTGRSRNDQVATAFRLYARTELDRAIELTRQCALGLVQLAEKHSSAVIPGYTHLQKAQPILWAHWCLAYVEMLDRDLERLQQARARTNVLPLGSGALSGNSFGVDRDLLARELGFASITRNSLDAVSDRDFVLDALFASSTLMMHLSRFSEDVILYSTNEFGFLELGDAISTGSSLMPQKKNPDALELLRGKSGRVFGHLMGMLAVTKGLPLAYNKDLQEDKETLFGALDTLCDSLTVARIVLENIHLVEDRALSMASKGYMNATELADVLSEKGIPFRSAHEIAGKAVLAAIEKGVELEELSKADFRLLSGVEFSDSDLMRLGLESTLARKNVVGGTAPQRVRDALKHARTRIEQ